MLWYNNLIESDFEGDDIELVLAGRSTFFFKGYSFGSQGHSSRFQETIQEIKLAPREKHNNTMSRLRPTVFMLFFILTPSHVVILRINFWC